MRILNLALASILSVTIAAVAADDEKNIVKNGDFEQVDANGTPDDWKMSGPNTRIDKESNSHVLVVLKVSGNFVSWAEQVVKLKPEWKQLKISCRMKAEDFEAGDAGWQIARLAGRFENDAGENLGYMKSPELKADSKWVTITRTSDIPKGATMLVLNPAHFGKAGKVYFDDIKIIPVK